MLVEYLQIGRLYNHQFVLHVGKIEDIEGVWHWRCYRIGINRGL